MPNAEVLLSALVLVGGVTWLSWQHRRREREHDQAIASLAERHGFTPVEDPQEHARLAEVVRELYPEVARHNREVVLQRVMCRRVGPIDVSVMHAVSNHGADFYSYFTLDKILVLCEGYDGDLPAFTLMPGSFLLRQVQDEPEVFDPGDGDPFARRNIVAGDDHERIRTVLSAEARELLADNRELALTARPRYLACYLHDDRPCPKDLPAFVEDCVTLATILHEQAKRR